MPAKLKPLIKTFTLVKTDETYGTPAESPTTVTIKQADQGTIAMRNSELLDYEIERPVFDDNSNTMARKKISSAGLYKIEICNTVVGCNLEDENGKAYFQFQADNRGPVSPKNFWDKWNMLDPTIAAEIYEFVLEINPLFGNSTPK